MWQKSSLPLPPLRSICVVGFAPETRELVSELPETVELWGMNINHKFMTRWDRWFQLHPPVWGGKPFYGRSKEHYEFLKTISVPLFMGHPNAEFPTAVLYPVDDVVKNIGRNYLTSTVAKAVAPIPPIILLPAVAAISAS